MKPCFVPPASVAPCPASTGYWGRDSGPPGLTIARTSPVLKARLGLEPLDARDVPANLGWTNLTGDGLFDTPANWRDLDTGQPAIAPPAPNDNLVYDGT